MKRFWLKINELENIKLDNTNKMFSIYKDQLEEEIVLTEGIYNLKELLKELQNKLVNVKIGEVKSEENLKFIVFILSDDYTLVQGDMIKYFGGIESVDNGDRLDENVVYLTN